MVRLETESHSLSLIRREIFAVLFLLLIALVIFSPELFLGRAFSNEEQFGFYYPINKYYQDELRSGGEMVWNADYYGGVSAALDQFVSAYFPLKSLVFALLPLYDAHHWMIAIGTFLGLGLAYWFGRGQGWSKSAALVFSISYLLATTLQWIQIGTTAAYSFIALPGMSLALSQIAKRRYNFRHFLLGATSLWLGLVAGFIQIVFYALFIAFFYALFLDWKAQRDEHGIKMLRMTGIFLAMALTGGLFALPQILPSISYIDLTIRTADYAIQNAHTPLPTELIAFFLPEFLRFPFVGGGSAGFYVGALFFMFAIIGLALYRSKEALFWLIAYFVILGFAFHLPVFSWINEHLPPFSRMGGNFRWMVIGAFPLAYLAGHGCSHFLNSYQSISETARKRILAMTGALSVFLLSTSGAAIFAIAYIRSHAELADWIIQWRFTGRSMTFTMERYREALFQMIDEAGSIVSLENPWFLASLLLWPATWAVFLLLFKNRLRREWIGAVFVSFAFLNTLVAFMPLMTSAIDRSAYETEPVISKVMKERETVPASYRFMGFLVGDGLYWEAFSKRRHSADEIANYHREYLINNTNLFWGIQRMDGMEPYRTLRANRLLNTVLAADEDLRIFAPGPNLREEGLNKLDNLHAMRRVTLEEKKADFLERLPLISMMNVRYIYSPYELRHSDLINVPLPPIEGISLQPTLYFNREVLPRIYFAGGVSFFKADELDALLAVAEVSDFRKTTVIECLECTKADTAGAGEVTVERYESGRVALVAATNEGGWLVFSEGYLPGWHALVNGKETTIYPANYLFQAIYVPAGKHKVEFVFRDAASEHLARLIKRVLQ